MADYPEWVLKHKKKGTYVNKVRDKYYLYAAHSERIKGTDKIRRVCDGYIGSITEKEGLIPSRDKVSTSVISYELGLSFSIISCTSRIHTGLCRTFLNDGDLIYVCSILSFIYGIYDKGLFEHSYLHLHFGSVIYPETFTAAQISGIERGGHMIADTFTRYFKDDSILVRAHFSNICFTKLNNKLYRSELSPVVITLSEKYKIDWSKTIWQK